MSSRVSPMKLGGYQPVRKNPLDKKPPQKEVKMSNLKIVMMVGLPLSGKSTYIDKLNKKPLSRIGVDDSYTIVCPDDVRLALGFEFHKPLENFVWAIVETMSRALLLRGQNIVVDATNLTEYSRRLWIDLAKQYQAKVEVFAVTTSAEECIQRAIDSNRRNMIPIIKRMSETSQPVSHEEFRDVSHRIISIWNENELDHGEGS